MNDNLERALETDRWNVTTLHEHLVMMINDLSRRMDERFDAQEKATLTAMAAAEKAVLKAENLASARAEQQNEWRATVTDLTQTMLPRNEYETIHSGMVKELDSLSARVDIKEGVGQGSRNVLAWIIACAGAMVGIVSLLIHFLAK